MSITCLVPLASMYVTFGMNPPTRSAAHQLIDENSVLYRSAYVNCLEDARNQRPWRQNSGLIFNGYTRVIERSSHPLARNGPATENRTVRHTTGYGPGLLLGGSFCAAGAGDRSRADT